MKLKFDENGLLSEEILARIRRPPDYRRRAPGKEADDKPREIPIYLFEVSGFAPELLRDMVSWRRTKHYNTKGKKVLKCPYCGGKFDSVDKEVKVRLRVFAINSKVPNFHTQTCMICKSVIGITYEKTSA